MVRHSATNRANVKLLLVDGDSHIRNGLQNALNAEGYRDIRTCGRGNVVHDILSASTPDAVIIDGDLPDRDALMLAKDIRRGGIGQNPYLPIILMTWNSECVRIRRAIDHGVDLILLKPLAPADLFSRINGVAFNRRPFLMTADYAGPSRRNKRRRGDTGCFDVPNTLKDKLEGKPVSLEVLSEQVELTQQRMNDSCVEKAAVVLTRTVAQVCNMNKNGDLSYDLREPMRQILRSTKVIQKHGPTQAKQFCKLIADIAKNAHHEPEIVDTKKIELLWPLAQSTLLASKVNLDTDKIMSEISNVVSSCRISSDLIEHFDFQKQRASALAA